MKVKISYSVDIDEIPDNVIKILQQASAGVDEVSKKFRNIIDKASTTREYLKILDEVDKIRKEMYQVDQQLEDAYDIVGGYQRVRMQQHEQQHRALEMADHQRQTQQPPAPEPEPEPAKTKGKK